MHRPKDNDIIPPKPDNQQQFYNNLYSSTFLGGFKRPKPTKTHDRIFSEEKKGREIQNGDYQIKGRIKRNYKGKNDHIGPLFESQGRIPIKREVKLTDNPCHDNFRVFSSEAKNNLIERYNNNQW